LKVKVDTLQYTCTCVVLNKKCYIEATIGALSKLTMHCIFFDIMYIVNSLRLYC